MGIESLIINQPNNFNLENKSNKVDPGNNEIPKFEISPAIHKEVLKKDEEEGKKSKLDTKKTLEIQQLKKEEELPDKEKQEIKIEKRRFDKLLDSAIKLRNILNDRTSKRLNPLLPDGGAQRIGQAVNEIGEILSKKSTDIDSLNAQILKIITTIDKIGSIRPRGQIREDPDSLKRLVFCLSQVADGSGSAIRNIVDLDPLQTEKTKKLLHGLFGKTQDKKNYVVRLLYIIQR